MSAPSTFRGYWAIKEVLDRMQPLAMWTKQFKPQQRHLTLPRTDYDLIRRWPKAAAIHEIQVVGSEVWFRGLELTYDGGPRRYEPPAAPTQTDVVEACKGEGAYSL